jgi:nucleoid DNA-binding protein
MTKSDLIEQLSRERLITLKQAEIVVNSVFIQMGSTC